MSSNVYIRKKKINRYTIITENKNKRIRVINIISKISNKPQRFPIAKWSVFRFFSNFISSKAPVSEFGMQDHDVGDFVPKLTKSFYIFLSM